MKPEFRKARITLALITSLALGTQINAADIARADGGGGLVTSEVTVPERTDNFFLQLLEDYPEGYQVDIVSRLKHSPKILRHGILNVSRDGEKIILDYRKKAGRIKDFRGELSGDEPFDQVHPLLETLLKSEPPYFIWPKVRSRNEFDPVGERLSFK